MNRCIAQLEFRCLRRALRASAGAKLTTLTAMQADYLLVPVEGPYKPDSYRY